MALRHRALALGRGRLATLPRRRASSTTTALDILHKQQEVTGSTTVQAVQESCMTVEAMRIMVERSLGSLVVRDSSDRVVGFVTQRDLLRCVVERGVHQYHTAEPVAWSVPVADVMTHSKDLVHLTPSDTLDEARSLMTVSGKRHVPVLSGDTLLGVIAPKDIARFLFDELHGDESAKEQYVSTVMRRKGMPLATRVATRSADEAAAEHGYALISAVCSLAHPRKEDTGGEDAFLLGPQMVGVADGVGSWWEREVNPADYARGLMHAAGRACAALKQHDVVPKRVLLEAWHEVRRTEMVGSATACLLALHPHKPELRAANVGDSGFLILRRHRPDRAGRALGTLDYFTPDYQRAKAAAEESGPGPRGGQPYHVAFRSPQQLRAFNTPFQLGHAPDAPPGGVPDDRFETPHDADLVRVPVKGGDLIVLATDGLFDNMTEEQVVQVVQDDADSDLSSLGADKSAADAAAGRLGALARRLAHRARELSLDTDTDSPFAVLAKDNDICWGGGRPDDTTVIVARVVDPEEGTRPPPFDAYTGPGEPPDQMLRMIAQLEKEKKESVAATVENFEEW